VTWTCVVFLESGVVDDCCLSHSNNLNEGGLFEQSTVRESVESEWRDIHEIAMPIE
jgi:hypothetical protein